MYFSVIVPVYNVKKYLPQCINTVLNQSFNDYELILIDDGSTDGSGQLCDEYSEAFHNIKTIHKINGGLSSARNIGLKAAIGKYIIFIDSDDYIISSSFFEEIHAKLKEKEYDLLLYKFQKIYDGDTNLKPCTFSMKEAEAIINSDALLLNLVKGDAYYGTAWAKTIRRELLVGNNIEFEEGLLGEDMEWYFHLLTVVKSISAIDKSYIAYRQREGSISKTNGLKNLTDYIYIIEKWADGIEKASINEVRKKALRGAMAKYYANLLITYNRVRDIEKRAYKTRVKNLHGLLKYSRSKRPKMIARVYFLFGFEGTLGVLNLIDKLKG